MLRRSSFLLLLVGLLWGCQPTGQAPAEDDQYFKTADFAGSHILVAYAGARNADASITRTKEEALAKAQDLIAQLKANPDQFAEVAMAESDGPSGARGGSLGSWNKGRMVPEFDTAIEQLEVGGITEEPVETGFGYHVILRESSRKKHYAAFGFVIGYAGAPNVPEPVSRSMMEADSLSKALAERITSDNFEELAAEYNDFGEGADFFGVIIEDDPQVPAEMMEALQSVGFDGVAGPIALRVGYAFIKRARVEQHAGAHILIAYAGAQSADESVTRSKEEAEALARDLIAQAQAAPDTFGELARTHSDGPSGPVGGLLGSWFKGAMMPAFDEAVESMEVNTIYDEPVETIFGYHVIQRLPVEEEGNL